MVGDSPVLESFFSSRSHSVASLSGQTPDLLNPTEPMLGRMTRDHTLIPNRP